MSCPSIRLTSLCLIFLHISGLLTSHASAASHSERLGERAPVPAGYNAPSYYPAPNGGWAADWQASYAKAQKLVSQMTLAEKTNITCGTGYFMGRCVGTTGSALAHGFPQFCLQDGPLGVRTTDNVTAFPAGITVGATFDKNLMYQRGVALGKEFRGKGANVYLGPSVGPLGRKPRGGRNWEGFGADPVLQAVAGAQTIKGVQEQGVIATIKHFIGNEQEMYRMYNPLQQGISSNIDDRALHELYLWPFAEGVRAGVGAVMAAYNAVNGSACSQNAYLINGILKDELGFQGFIMTDWLAQISGVASALAGLDMSQPGDAMIPLLGNSFWAYELTRAVLNGSVPVSRVNDMATRVVAVWYQMGQDQGFPPPNFSAWTSSREGPYYPGALISPSGVVNDYVNVQADHAKLARQIAQDAITLVKNANNSLPLRANATLKVFGSDAQKNPDGVNSCTDKACNKGTLGMGWGSGSANYPYLDDPISAIKTRSKNLVYYNSDTFPLAANASVSDVAIVFITSDSGENSYTVEGNHGDRDASGLKAWHGGDDLVKKAAATYATVIVVVHTIGPILVEEWIDLPSVKAVLFAHLPGQEAGASLTNILFGDISPSGHLPYSIPVKESDYPSSVSLVSGDLLGDLLSGQPQDTFSEGLYIDYRSLNKNKIKPRFPFGHGLSYTSFNYSSPTIRSIQPLTSSPPAPPPKNSTPTYNTTIPPPSEASYPDGFTQIWRYIYSYLSKSDAAAAHTIGTTSTTSSNTSAYPYPPGYTTTQRTSHPPAGGAPGGNPALWDTIYTLSVTVTNTGAVSGKAVVQAYVQFPTSFAYDTPVVQLRDFAKTRVLAVGERQVVTLKLTRKDLSVWDVRVRNWVAATGGGEYVVWVGESVVDFRVRCGTVSGCRGVGEGESPVM